MRNYTGRRALKTVLIILCVLLILAASAALFIHSKLSRINYSGKTVTEAENPVPAEKFEPEHYTPEEGLELRDSGAELPEGEAEKSGGIINILLIGSDYRMPGSTDIGRGDVTMLVSLDKDTGRIGLASFERGTGVPWTGHGDVMLTSFYKYNGAQATTDVLSRCFLVDIAGYVHVDFDSFMNVIDAVGGVDIELSNAEAWAINNGLGYPALQQGMNHLNGDLALRYCRLRSIDDNWNRTGRQRNTIQALINKTKTLSISELNSLADTVLPMIDTNLTELQIAGIMLSAPKFIGATASQLMVPDKANTWYYVGSESVLGCDYSSEAGRLRDFIYGTD